MDTAEACAKAWSELHRVADSVFICVPAKTSIWAWFVRDHHLWVKDMGDGLLEVTERATGKKVFCEVGLKAVGHGEAALTRIRPGVRRVWGS